MAKHKRHHSSHKMHRSSMSMSHEGHTGKVANREMNPSSRDFYADDDMIHEVHAKDNFNLPTEVMRKEYRNPSAGLPGDLEYGIDEVNRNQSENHMQFRKQFKISRS